jgi:hypothetical protein
VGSHHNIQASEEMSIEILRLKSGEDIICDIKSEVDGLIVIENPAVIIPTSRGDDGVVTMGLSPWMPYSATETFDLKTEWLVTKGQPSEQMQASYSQMYGLIFTPEKKIILN